jgi:hypothetical protein
MTQELTPSQVANALRNKIKELTVMRDTIESKAAEKALSKCNYRKDVAVSLLQLLNGKIKEFKGELISNKLTASDRKIIAEGICAESEARMEIGESGYKSHIVCMGAIESELNGIQSINRHLSHEVQ